MQGVLKHHKSLMPHAYHTTESICCWRLLLLVLINTGTCHYWHLLLPVFVTAGIHYCWSSLLLALLAYCLPSSTHLCTLSASARNKFSLPVLSLHKHGLATKILGILGTIDLIECFSPELKHRVR